MRVRFWGTRGSIATPGPGTNHFGGNTSCVELTTAGGDLLIFDCGTGARGLAAELMAQGVALSASDERAIASLDELRVGAETAREIGWARVQ